MLHFCGLYVVDCCCAANQYSEIGSNFLRISNQRARSRVNKSEITGEKTSIGDHVGIYGNHE